VETIADTTFKQWKQLLTPMAIAALFISLLQCVELGIPIGGELFREYWWFPLCLVNCLECVFLSDVRAKCYGLLSDIQDHVNQVQLMFIMFYNG
jgi:hypothetical protein